MINVVQNKLCTNFVFLGAAFWWGFIFSDADEQKMCRG